jgi:hypothetical protein
MRAMVLSSPMPLLIQRLILSLCVVAWVLALPYLLDTRG